MNHDERETWPSRLSFALASMRGAVEIGNLLRYPSTAAKHSGLQLFTPYLLALLLIGIPAMILEISLGERHGSAGVGAKNTIHRRIRGLEVCSALIAFTTVTNCMNNMSYILSYIRNRFTSLVLWSVSLTEFRLQSCCAKQRFSWSYNSGISF